MHPYSDLPIRNFWKKFVSESPWAELNLYDLPKFKINENAKIATAGSCFAQHISRYLSHAGIDTYIVEKAHPIIIEFEGDAESYNLFSARYGNIYTARQFHELYKQAFGIIPIIEDFHAHNDRYFDLLRPNVEKKGFNSIQEARADRAYHLLNVKKMFQTSDVLIFTLGLTESWCNSEFSYTYPSCPGTVKGEFNSDLHIFHNFSHFEICTDLEQLIIGLTEFNPSLKIILTVSPIPLVATNTSENVLIASSYSKSVLRAAAGEISSKYDHVSYFPSYEIINHPASFGQYLSSDLREVTERGVKHVMSCFMKNFFHKELKHVSQKGVKTNINEIKKPNDQLVECDELMNMPDYINQPK